MKKFALLLLLVGCSSTPLTEAELYEREDRRNLIIEDYHQKVADCEAAGGFMVMRSWGFRRVSIHEMRSAYCAYNLRNIY